MAKLMGGPVYDLYPTDHELSRQETKEEVSMRALIFIIVIAVVGLVAYNFLTTGELTLKPGGSLSSDEQAVKELRDEFLEGQEQYRQAGRAVAVSGVDATADVEDFLADLDSLYAEAKRLKPKLTSQPAKRDLDRLIREIAVYRGDVQ